MINFTTIAELAAELGKNKSTISRHVARLGVGTRIGPVIALSLSEAAKVRKAIAEARPGNPNAATARLGVKSKKNPEKKPKKQAPKKTSK